MGLLYVFLTVILTLMGEMLFISPIQKPRVSNARLKNVNGQAITVCNAYFHGKDGNVDCRPINAVLAPGDELISELYCPFIMPSKARFEVRRVFFSIRRFDIHVYPKA